MNPLDNMTVAVTNFHRPELLSRALKSVREAGVRRVVIAAICPEPAVMAVIEGHRNAHPWLSFDVAVVRADIGCNATWMLAAYRSRTERIIVLHDDDLLAPGLGRAYCEIISPALDTGIGFATWRAGLYMMNGAIHPAEYRNGPTEVLPVSELFSVVGKMGRLSLSPIVGLLNRGIVIDACKEAEQTLTSKESFHRPGMLYGTEIVVYLRHIKAFPQWLYVNQMLAYYGYHNGSGTVEAMQRKKTQPLTIGYDIARRQVEREKPPLNPRFILTYNEYEPRSMEAKQRNIVAEESWQHLYSKGEFIALPVKAGDLNRTGNAIGDTGEIPFVCDLFDFACRFARPEDVIVYVNRDIGLTTLATHRILAGIERGRGVTVCPRRRLIPRRGQLYPTVAAFKPDVGIDVFAFTPKWWTEVGRAKMPDMLIGREAWDTVFATIAEEWADDKPMLSSVTREPAAWWKSRAYTDDVCWHHPHNSEWYSGAARYTMAGQIHNRALGYEFYLARGDAVMVAALDPVPKLRQMAGRT